MLAGFRVDVFVSKERPMIATVTVFKSRKPKRLVSPSDKWSKRKLIAKLTSIEKFQKAKKGKGK